MFQMLSQVFQVEFQNCEKHEDGLINEMTPILSKCISQPPHLSNGTHLITHDGQDGHHSAQWPKYGGQKELSGNDKFESFELIS